MKRTDIAFSDELLQDYVTITETPIDVTNGRFLASKRTDLERQILIIVKAVASDMFSVDEVLLSECCGAPAGEFEDVGICPECREHCEWEGV